MTDSHLAEMPWFSQCQQFGEKHPSVLDELWLHLSYSMTPQRGFHRGWAVSSHPSNCDLLCLMILLVCYWPSSLYQVQVLPHLSKHISFKLTPVTCVCTNTYAHNICTFFLFPVLVWDQGLGRQVKKEPCLLAQCFAMMWLERMRLGTGLFLFKKFCHQKEDVPSPAQRNHWLNFFTERHPVNAKKKKRNEGRKSKSQTFPWLYTLVYLKITVFQSFVMHRMLSCALSLPVSTVITHVWVREGWHSKYNPLNKPPSLTSRLSPWCGRSCLAWNKTYATNQVQHQSSGG